MVVSIRIPAESPRSLLPQYGYYRTPRGRSPLSTRGCRRLAPLLVLSLVVLVETYRFFHAGVAGGSSPPPPPDESYDLAPPLAGLSHLVVVAGHAIYLPGAVSLGAAEGDWVLEPYQRGRRAQDSFVAHIRAGVDIAAADKRALLVFSGGETRRDVGPRTEAAGYFELAAQRGWVAGELLNRTTTEPAALDSYQNLLFSLLRFHELTDRWPAHVTIVSYAFKRERFVALHRAAIRWPRAAFTFVGVDPEWRSDADRAAAVAGERANAARLWARDPYACADGGLRAKRRTRNAGRRRGYVLDGVEGSVKLLLRWCGDGGARGEVFGEHRLPWDREVVGEGDGQARTTDGR